MTKIESIFRRSNFPYFLLALILLAGTFLRFYKLDLMPLHYDEFFDTIQGNRLILEGKAETFLGIPWTLYYGRYSILYNLFTLCVSFFSENPVFIARIPAAFFGSLTLGAVFLLTQRLYNLRTALLSTCLLAFLPWHMITSRIGLKIVLVPLISTFSFYFLYRGLTERKQGFFLGAWALLGLTAFYTYPLALMHVPIFLIGYFLFRGPKAPHGASNLIKGFLVFTILVLPFLVLSRQYAIFAAPSSWFITDNTPLSHPFFIPILFLNGTQISAIHLKALFLGVLHAQSFYAPSIHLPLVGSALLGLLGIIAIPYLAVRQTRSDFFVLGWFFTALFFCSFFIFTYEERYSARYLIAILPAPIILIARLLDQLSEWAFSKPNLLAKLSMTIFLGVVLTQPLLHDIDYFRRAPRNPLELRVYSWGSREAAKFLSQIDLPENSLIVSDHAMTVPAYLPYERALHRKDALITTQDFSIQGHREAPAYAAFEEADRTFLAKHPSVYYVLWAPEAYHGEELFIWSDYYRTQNYINFRKKYPLASPLQTFFYPDGTPAVKIYKVP